MVVDSIVDPRIIGEMDGIAAGPLNQTISESCLLAIVLWIWGHMGTCSTKTENTIYEIIAPFLLEMGKIMFLMNHPPPDCENDQHEICFVSVFGWWHLAETFRGAVAAFASSIYWNFILDGFYGFLNLYFFPKVSLHFCKFLVGLFSMKGLNKTGWYKAPKTKKTDH